LKEVEYSKKIFKKVIAIDQLPKLTKLRNSAYVINADKHDKPGEHWIATFYDKRGKCDFFDSFGMGP
jgi:hypothetical protein